MEGQIGKIGNMGNTYLSSINTLTGLYMSSVAKIDGVGISNGVFRSTWHTDESTLPLSLSVAGTSSLSGSYSISLPLINTGTYDFIVDWGDSSLPDHITTYNQPEVLHTYVSQGTYSISIKGICSGWSFQQQPDESAEGGLMPTNPSSDCLKIISIEEWGCLRLGATTSNFSGCLNLKINSVIDRLNLRGYTSLYGLFNNCWTLTTINRLNEWNLSNITNTSYMFYSTAFNQNIGSWNVVSTTNMKAMFSYDIATFLQYAEAVGLTGPGGTESGTQSLLTWGLFNNGGTSSINNWNTSNVTNMSYMFNGCTNFNQPVGSWTTSNVTNMSYMFKDNIYFNQDISNWNVSNVTNFDEFMNVDNYGTGSFTYLDAIYSTASGWASRTMQSGIGKTIDFGYATFSSAGLAGKNIITSTYGWTIIDSVVPPPGP
jgi:surface protein